MDTNTPSQESGPAGKPGEPTAAASAAQRAESNLTPAGIASLLASEFAEAGLPQAESSPAASAAGKPEVRPAPADARAAAPKKETASEPQWTPDQTAWFELRAKATTPEEIAAADAQAPEFSEVQRAWIESQNTAPDKAGGTPSAVLAQVKAWEETGGALPEALQAIVDKRIGREVGKVKDLESRAKTAEAEVQRLTAELDVRPTPAAPSLATDEKTLTKLASTYKTFQADARAYIGGYADDAQTQRVEKWMQQSNLDDKGLKRQLDEANDWLSETLPALRQRAVSFRQQEAQITPIVKARFASLEKSDSDEAKFAAEVRQFLPELNTRTPAHALAVGCYALGKLAWEHLSKASAEGDVVETLRTLLTQHAPLPVNGNGNGQGKPQFFLPGRAPKKAPTGQGMVAPRVNSARGAEEAAASEELKQSPTAENAAKALKLALR